MAKAKISKSNKTFKYTNAADIITITGSSNKIYTKGGADKITLSKGKNNLIDAGTGKDIIIVGKKAGSGNTVMAGAGKDIITISGGTQVVDGGAGNDTFTVSGGTQTIKGGTGNDTITVKGGNNHILSGGTGSDKYIINTAISKSSFLTIDQSEYKKKDADVLQLTKVSKKDVKLGIASGTLSIKHKTGGGIIVTGYDKNKLSKIQFKDGTMTAATVTKTSKKTKATNVTWGTGKKVTLDARKIVSELNVTGHKVGDFVATVSNGKLVLREKGNDTGLLTINNWKNNTISKFVFKVGNYSRTLTAAEFKDRTFTQVALKDNQVYRGGKDEHQEFRVNFSEKTNIVIDSVNGVRDRIAFSNPVGWSNSYENIKRSGTDLIIGNWDSENKKELAGQITIKNFMNSSVKQVEYSNQTYYLITHSGTYTGSDTYSDRFMILDWSKTTGNTEVGDWNITLDGVRNNDWIDFRMLPANSQFYSMPGVFDGRDMVLNYWYSPDSNSDTKLGTLRLKNFFNADGTVNTTYGYPQIRINREFYTGNFNDYGPVWDRIKGSSENYTSTEKNYRNAYLNAGTANADEVDLGNLAKPNNNRVWLYYAGDGNDTVTARAGDIAYGGNGNDAIRAAGRMSEIRGDAGNDALSIFDVTNGRVNLDHVNAYGGQGNDTITACGSYLYLAGGSGNDDITIDNGSGEEAHTSCITGGPGDDTITIRGGNNHCGYDHRIYGSGGNDTLYAYDGHDHQLYGGAGNDTINLVSGNVKDSKAYGGDGEDILSVEGGAQKNCLYGGDGNDTLNVFNGSNNLLVGGEGDDYLKVNYGYDNELYGGDGEDTFAFSASSYAGNNTICDFTVGEDMIEIINGDFSSNEIDGEDRVLTFQSGGTVRILGAKDMALSFSYRSLE